MTEARIHRSRPRKQTMQVIENALTQIKLPEKGEQLRIRTQQQFNMVAFVAKIADQHHAIDELSIATYTINSEAWDIIIGLLEAGRIKKLNLVLASSYSFRDDERYKMMKSRMIELSQMYDVHLSFVWLHLKITLARCGDNFYQIEGSMNYSMNNMAENILFENGRAIYEHDYEFITKTMFMRGLSSTEVVC